MGSAMDVVEISSDDEDFPMPPKKLSDFEWAAELFDEDEDEDGTGEDFDDVLVMSELSVPPAPQKKGKPDGCGGDAEDDDCMVLDSDPDKVVNLADDKESTGDGSSDELQIVGEKGPVACRDFPHSRHSCSNLPFSTTSHVKHCRMCHCFVCDAPAPCSYWGTGVLVTDHCHATDKEIKWKTLRQAFKHKSLQTSRPEKYQNAIQPTITSPREQNTHRQGTVQTSQPALLSNISHSSLVNQSPLPNAVSQNKQRHSSVRISLNGVRAAYAPIGSPVIRAGIGAINARSTQMTRPRPRFKRVGPASPGLTTKNANQCVSAAPCNDLMHQALPHISQPVQAEPTANAFADSIKNNAPQRSLSAPITYEGQPAVPCQVASNGMHGVGPQLSRCSSLVTNRTQPPGSIMDVCRLSWQDMLLSVASDLGVSDYNICTSQSKQPVRTSSQPLLSSANQGFGLHAESAATANLMSSNGHDLSSHTTDGNIQADGLRQTSHNLNCLGSLGRNEANQSFASPQADGSMVGADISEYSELDSPDLLFDFEIDACY